MTKSVTLKIDVQPIPGPLGAVIECGDLRNVTASDFGPIRKAWLDHLVLAFRGHTLDDGELLRFCSLFGTLGMPPSPAKMAANQAPRDSRYPEIGVISNIIENGLAIGAFGAGEAVWHTDMAYEDIPHDGTMLYSLEVPPVGGDTWFGNMYYVYDALTPSLRKRLSGLKIKHDLTYKPDGMKRKGVDAVEDIRKTPGSVHPIIRTHPETGQNAIYVGQRKNAYIVGLPLEESEALLNELWSYVNQPRFCWHHQWKVGDLLVWDNRCVMHRRDSFDEKYRRLMHQARVTGTKPVELESGATRPPHPRGFMQFPAASAA